MKKVLPYVVNNDITIQCWHHRFTGILLGYDVYEPWYIENLISYTLDEGLNLFYQNPDSIGHLTYYDEVLDIREISDKSNILDTVKKAIDKGEYVHLFWELFHVRGSFYYEKERDIWHNALIFGYDDDEKVIHFSEVHINGQQWGIFTLEYDAFEKAFYGALDKYNCDEKHDFYNNYKWYIPAFTVALKPFNRPVNLYRLYKTFKDHIQGRIIINTGDSPIWLDSFCNKNRTEYFGLSVYKGFYENLYNCFLDFIEEHGDKKQLNEALGRAIIRTMYIFAENKNALLYRILYLKNNEIIPVSEETINNLNYLSTKSKKLSQLIYKYYYSSDKRLLDKWKNMCIGLEKVERDIINVIIESIEKKIRESL